MHDGEGLGQPLPTPEDPLNGPRRLHDAPRTQAHGLIPLHEHVSSEDPAESLLVAQDGHERLIVVRCRLGQAVVRFETGGDGQEYCDQGDPCPAYPARACGESIDPTPEATPPAGKGRTRPRQESSEIGGPGCGEGYDDHDGAECQEYPDNGGQAETTDDLHAPENQGSEADGGGHGGQQACQAQVSDGTPRGLELTRSPKTRAPHVDHQVDCIREPKHDHQCREHHGEDVKLDPRQTQKSQGPPSPEHRPRASADHRAQVAEDEQCEEETQAGPASQKQDGLMSNGAVYLDPHGGDTRQPRDKSGALFPSVNGLL